VAMLAEMVDGVIGVDTHRDFHQVEVARPSGAVIATHTFKNDSAGHAEALAWMVKHAPGPRLVISIEGTRSYGVGLARAAATAGLAVIEAEQPTRKHRRGKDKSDRIDAHLAVLYALGLDADKLPTPRADGDREALRILLCARQELTTTTTGQTNRLRALLRDGDDTDRRLARARLTDTVLASLARRRLPPHASRQQAVRHSEIRRLALALRQAARALSTNRAELAGIVHDLAPGLLDQPGIGPVSAAQAIVSFSHAGRCRSDAAFAKLAAKHASDDYRASEAAEIMARKNFAATGSFLAEDRPRALDLIGVQSQLVFNTFHNRRLHDWEHTGDPAWCFQVDGFLPALEHVSGGPE